MKTFHPSHLDHDASFRESLRYKPSFSTERLDRAQTILSEALQKHGAETLTRENFDKVSESMKKDPRWHGMYSAGSEFESALKTHLRIAEK